MGFITELISGDKKRAHEEEKARMAHEENMAFMKQLEEQNKMTAESNKSLFDMINRGNSEADALYNVGTGGGNDNAQFDYSKYMPNQGNDGRMSDCRYRGDDGGGNQIMVTPDRGQTGAGDPTRASGGNEAVDHSLSMPQFDNTSNSYQSRSIDQAQGNLDKAVANPFFNPWNSEVEGGGPVTDKQLAFSENRNRAYADMFGLDYEKAANKTTTPDAGNTPSGDTTKADPTGNKGEFKDLDGADAPWTKKPDDEFVDLDKTEPKSKSDKIDEAGAEFDKIGKDEKPTDPAKAEKIDALKGRIDDVKGEIDQRVKSGELSKEEGDAMKGKLDEKLKAAEEGEGTEGADKALKEVNTLDNNLNKIGDLKGRIDDVKGEIDARVKSGEMTEEEGNAAKGKLDDKMNAVKTGEVDADKATESVNKTDNNLNHMGKLNERVADVKGEIDQRVKDGKLTQEEGDKVKAKIDEKVEAVKNGDGDAKALTGEINKLDNNLNKLGALDKRADDVTSEIDQRVKDGQLSQEAGDKAKADITDNVGKARETLLDLDSKNAGSAADGETPKTDREVFANTRNNINNMDNYLNELAGLDTKADAAKQRLDQQVADGSITQDDATKQTKEIDAKQKATELHTLEWA